MQGPEDGESHQHNGLEPLAEVEGALLVVEVLHLPHPELGGLLRGGEHYLKSTKNESAAAEQHKHHAECMNNALQASRRVASPRLASPRPWMLLLLGPLAADVGFGSRCSTCETCDWWTTVFNAPCAGSEQRAVELCPRTTVLSVPRARLAVVLADQRD